MNFSDTLYQRHELQGSRVGDDLVIFDARAGKYFATGPVGADIWTLLETPLSARALQERLMAIYAIDAETCQSQVQDFLAKMVEADLVTEVTAG